MGRELRPIPPSCVKAFVKHGKSDALDAEAICEAV
jgi:transposase